jgi:hypothetical protein
VCVVFVPGFNGDAYDVPRLTMIMAVALKCTHCMLRKCPG